VRDLDDATTDRQGLEDASAATPGVAQRAPRSGVPTGRRRKRRRKILVWSAGLVLVLVAIAGSLVYTEQSSFCPTCHEMRPYYTAWQAGGHARSAQCVDCHVPPGIIAHLAHKPAALKEVWDHFFADSRFPNYSVEMPDARCTACHTTVPAKIGALFSHKLHETKAHCKDCHATTGHLVSLQALADAGILKSGATGPMVPTGQTPSRAPGHIRVVCQDCHDQAHMRCSACHQAPHDPRGECSKCHKPGTKFVFVHPALAAGTDCGACHRKPAGHLKVTGACVTCHKSPSGGWTFSHPASGSACQDCHTPPANHFGVPCSQCHTPGVAFANTVFTHPSNTGAHTYRSFPCVKCHPNNYTTASCTCHGGSPPTGD
jgi:nitrate/TMAO reductase-like tetraheme cytochrome c subunit